MIDKDQVLQLVAMKGYVLPSDLTRQFHADTFIMGAVLSDLVREKKLSVSRVKVGRSPVYYTQAHRAKLQDLYKYLNEKDRQVYDLLKQQIVLREKDQPPLVRVSLKNMKDFAKPIEVTVAGIVHLFYKWYLATDQEVHSALTSLLSPRVEQQAPQITPARASFAEDTQPAVTPHVERVSVEKRKEQVEKIQEKPVVQEKKSVERPIIVEEKKPQVKKIEESVQKHAEEQQHLSSGDDLLTRLLSHEDPFSQDVGRHFSTHNISVVHFKHVKKGELDCVVKVPSAVGDIMYYCKAKKKKKCNEGDLATAFVAAQMKKLPALFLTPGNFPKKVLQKLSTDYPNTKILTLEVKS